MKHNNIHIIGVPEEEREQGIENLFEKIRTKTFPNLVRDNIHISPGSAESQTRSTQRDPLQHTS